MIQSSIKNQQNAKQSDMCWKKNGESTWIDPHKKEKNNLPKPTGPVWRKYSYWSNAGLMGSTDFYMSSIHIYSWRLDEFYYSINKTFSSFITVVQVSVFKN